MKRKGRQPTERAARREAERTQEKLGEARERLLAMEPGGRAERPLEVASPAVVETHAHAVPCPRCGGPHEVVEHAAVTIAGQRLREARLRCRQCGSRRSLWFRLVGPALN